MRTVWPERRTLPSRISPTLSLRAIVPRSVSFPWKEKADVRAATCSPLISARELRISSVRPSEKYSCSLSPLKLMNGRTATECAGGVKAATSAATVGDDAESFPIQPLSMAKYATAEKSNTATASDSPLVSDPKARPDVRSVPPDPAWGLVDGGIFAGVSDDNRRLMRSTKAEVVSPAGRRVHCTARKRSGTIASLSPVLSTTTGTRKCFCSAMSWVRSMASFHSRRK